ncbi:MAG: aminotransferase class I/II-fold pyridoxal phosphate-dependent enzyme [Acidobacteriota bacterium]
MYIEEFALERYQSLYENEVDINLTESGVHPYTMRELLTQDELEEVLDVRLGYGWTNGNPALREAIAQYYPGATADNVLVTNGSAESNFLHTWTRLEPGDEVVVMVPNYLQIWGIARSMDCQVKSFSLDESQDWAPNLDELRSKVTDATRLIVVCNPNNPTGAVMARDDMEAIAEIAAEHDADIYSDEVYKGVELEGPEGPSFRDVTARATVASGLSKALAHPGLRIGWLVGSEEFIAQAWRRNDYTTITTSPLSEAIATIILQPERREQILERNRTLLRQNLGVLQDWIAGQGGRFSLIPPKAGGMTFLGYDLEHEGQQVNSTRLSEWLRVNESLLVVAGDVYGLDGHLRLGIGEEPETFKAGLERLARGVERADRGELVG